MPMSKFHRGTGEHNGEGPCEINLKSGLRWLDMNNLERLLFHMVCRRNSAETAGAHDDSFEVGLRQTREYFGRLGHRIDVKGKSVLDVGCGYGATCVYVADQGAKRVLGIDIDQDRLEAAKEKLRVAYSPLRTSTLLTSWPFGRRHAYCTR